MYAYDTPLYTSTTFNNLNDTITEINNLTTELKIYFNNYLKFNKPKKPKIEFIIFNSK